MIGMSIKKDFYFINKCCLFGTFVPTIIDKSIKNMIQTMYEIVAKIDTMLRTLMNDNIMN